MNLKRNIGLSLCLIALFSGCNSGSSNSSNTSSSSSNITAAATVVTVERGAVLDASVKDANGEIAIVESKNTYKFTKEIGYPITVTGGFIDVDDSGDKSVGDVQLTIPLMTYSGTNITLITTAIADSNETIRNEKLEALANSLGTTKEELLKLPSQSYDSSILSNELYSVLTNDTNLELKQIISDLNINGISTNFKSKKSAIDTSLPPKSFALNLEQEYINKLVEAGKLTLISYDDIKLDLPSDYFELSLFHVNDIHSHISSEELTYTINGNEKKVETGGYARIITKLNELKSEKPNSLILNAGDAFQGTLFYSLFKGEADAAAMNLISWDAYALGNHEFDDGDEGLKSFLDRLDSDISVISANVVPSSNNILKDYWTPYVIKEVNGKKVGIIGIDISNKTKDSSNPSEEIIFLNELETAQKYIDELTTLGIDKIVLLTHQGYENDLNMAKELRGVDVIIGGDSHTLLGDFTNIGLNSISNNYPVNAKSKDNKKVCVAHAWEYAHILGNLDVIFNDKGEVLACGGNPLLLVEEDLGVENKNVAVVAENAEALAVIKTYEDQVEVKKATKIGTAGVTLGHNRIPGDKRDGVSVLPLGSDIAPIVAKSFYDLSNLADACIQNAGGVRVAVESGEITLGTAYTLLPFANTLFEIKMTGSEIKQVLEDALNNTYASGGSTGSFPYSYGLKYDIDVSLGDNSRISNLEIKNRQTGVWGDIEADKMYTIVINSFTAGGKDGYLTFKTVQDQRGLGVDTYLDYAMSFVKYVETKTANNETVIKLPASDHPIKSYKDESGKEIKVINDIERISVYNSGVEAGSEIVAFDEVSKKMFVTNGAENKIDILQVSYNEESSITTTTKSSFIDLSSYGSAVQSVSVKNQKVAVAVGSANKATTKGSVVVFDTSGTHIKTVEVGYLPDMVTFNENGTKIVVANEGEPDENYDDPVGSIGIIDITNNYSYTDIGFENVTIPENVIIKKDSSATIDLEPEYITVRNDIAYVTLQENNAIAIVDLNTKSISVKALGFKDHSKEENSLDIQEDGNIELKTYSNLYGLYMPDSIASYSIASKTYLVTANEGDGREWGDYVNEIKISKLLKNSKLSDELTSIYTGETNDLKVHSELGLNADGKYEKLYTFGARSFSIWDENATLVFDSANELAKLTQEYMPTLFNQDEGELDGRSGNKGVEPEALAVGEIQDNVFAFVGLERQNAIAVFDITNSTNVKFVKYIITQDNGDISPEGMKFVKATNSPTGKPLLIVAYEVSGTTAIYEIK